MPDTDTPIAQSHLDLERRVRTRAHEIWLSHQDQDGKDTALDDWLQAERDVLGDDPRWPAQARGATVGHAFPPDPLEMEEPGEA